MNRIRNALTQSASCAKWQCGNLGVENSTPTTQTDTAQTAEVEDRQRPLSVFSESECHFCEVAIWQCGNLAISRTSTPHCEGAELAESDGQRAK
jgi:hypothetical protein